MNKKSVILAVAMSLMASYGTAQDIQLPAPDKNVSMTLMEALQKRASRRSFASAPLTDMQLSQLLWAACGINREDSKRITAPSAINAQDILVYVCRADGVFLYDPAGNQLKKIADDDTRAAGERRGATDLPPVLLVLVSDLSKFGARAGSAAETMGTFDAGYVSENICLACTALGLETVPRMMMDKDALRQALRLNEKQVLMLNHPVGYAK